MASRVFTATTSHAPWSETTRPTSPVLDRPDNDMGTEVHGQTPDRDDDLVHDPSVAGQEQDLPVGAATSDAPAEWWRTAVVYQVYLRSFTDGDGDGIGDVAGLRARLDHIVSLGADAIWISPWYPSPMFDAGYDVADPRGIDPLFGTLEDGEELLAQAHRLGLRVLLDIVPNHTEFSGAEVPGRPGRRPGSSYLVSLPARQGSERRPTAEQLDLRFRRAGLDPDDRSRRNPRRLVPAHVLGRPARPELGESCRGRGLRDDAAVLVRSGDRRIPDRLRERSGQGRRAAGPRQPGGG